MALLDVAQEGPLREALSIFTGLGASAAARITRQKMRACGIRSIPAGPRTATRAHPLGLTRSEREVLDLICAGHTNAEIAARLFIHLRQNRRSPRLRRARETGRPDPRRCRLASRPARAGRRAKSRLRQVGNGLMPDAAASGTATRT
jgi:hypothetical protein